MVYIMASTQGQSNVGIVQSGYAAFAEGDIETVLGRMADDIEWTEPKGNPAFAGTYHGPEEVLKNVFEPALQDFAEFSLELDRTIDGGDTVVVLGSFHVTTEAGKTFESPFAHVWDLEDGQLTKLTNYTDTALWE